MLLFTPGYQNMSKILNMFAFVSSSSSSAFDWDRMKDKSQKFNEELTLKIKTLEEETTQLNEELSRLTTWYVKGIIKEGIFTEQSTTYENQITNVESRLLKF